MTYNDVRRFPVLWTATAQRDVLAIVAWGLVDGAGGGDGDRGGDGDDRA